MHIFGSWYDEKMNLFNAIDMVCFQNEKDKYNKSTYSTNQYCTSEEKWPQVLGQEKNLCFHPAYRQKVQRKRQLQLTHQSHYKRQQQVLSTKHFITF